ncbi:DUF975 family protein [Tissierella sp. Yu-01]|uniref:DUF975 family protein n=1 Tax=Tissierella sp. Yu-01 TaxID=3035694 RepID=UPI00240D128D|nr:DUF975 family protein [Tissierella sp. Yu-01]WFA08763.1 DUF975 family protein [Tissierella sp. Yu-01]
MWTRAEIKTYAKEFLKKHYWKAFIVCLIFTIITGNHFNRDEDFRVEYNYNIDLNEIDGLEDGRRIPLETAYDGLNFFLGKIGKLPLAFIGTSIFLFAILAFIVIQIFIFPLLEVGKNRFFLKAFEDDVDIKYLFSAFNKDEYWGIVSCMFVTGLYQFFWSLLLIIPGIVKAYEYKFVPYILTKEPHLTAKEAIEKSRFITEDEKWNMFVLDLSFLGWQLLGMLFFGVGGVFVNPYIEATYARLYNVLNGEDDNMDEESDYILE